MRNKTEPALSLWFSAPRTVELRRTPIRPPSKDEIRVRALCSGISHGTELLIYRGEAPRDLTLDLTISTLVGSYSFPIKYGYASVGQVLEAGRDAASIAEGDMVFAFNPHESEFTLPAHLAIKLPVEIDARRALFLANVETAINAILDAAPRLGERVLILGQGVVGLLINQLARRAGAGLVIVADLFAKRRDLAMAFGADLAIDPLKESVSARVKQLTAGLGVDIVIEASGRPEALGEAIKSTAIEGRVIIVSWYGTKRAELALSDDFHRNRITIKSSQVSNLDPSLLPRWSTDRRRELALSFLSTLRLSELITHTYPIEDAASAYRIIDERPEEVVQVILKYGAGGRPNDTGE